MELACQIEDETLSERVEVNEKVQEYHAKFGVFHAACCVWIHKKIKYSEE